MMIEERLVIFLKMHKTGAILLATIAIVVVYCFATETWADRDCLKQKYAVIAKGESVDYARKIEQVCHILAKKLWPNGVPK